MKKMGVISIRQHMTINRKVKQLTSIFMSVMISLEMALITRKNERKRIQEIKTIASCKQITQLVIYSPIKSSAFRKMLKQQNTMLLTIALRKSHIDQMSNGTLYLLKPLKINWQTTETKQAVAVPVPRQHKFLKFATFSCTRTSLAGLARAVSVVQLKYCKY